MTDDESRAFCETGSSVVSRISEDLSHRLREVFLLKMPARRAVLRFRSYKFELWTDDFTGGFPPVTFKLVIRLRHH